MWNSVCAVTVLGFLLTTVNNLALPLEATPKGNATETPGNRTRILTYSGSTGFFNGVNNQREQYVVFPESEKEVDFDLNMDSAPKCARGSTFCEDFEGYPYYQVEDVLRRSDSPINILGDDASDDFVNRIGVEEEDQFLCKSTRRLVFPRVAKNKDDQWRIIINQEDAQHRQGISIETCNSENLPCDIIGGDRNDYKTMCKQKYFHRKLFAVSNKGSIEIESFEFPAACCCSYTRSFDYFLLTNGHRGLRLPKKH